MTRPLRIHKPPPEPAAPAADFEGLILPIVEYQQKQTDKAVLAAEERGFRVAWEMSRAHPELDAETAYRRWNGEGKKGN